MISPRHVMVRVLASGIITILTLGMNTAQAAGDAGRGGAAFVRQCALCHTVGKGEPNRYGPNLFGVLDRKAGIAEGFKYSPAFKSMASWYWTSDVLGAWLSSPAKMVPGTTMGMFQGTADKDKDDLIAYLAAHK
jgi:cytochrome c